MDKITTTIKRQWLSEIVARKKKTEYRGIKPYWNKRLAQVETPFLLRLINGMVKQAPEVTVTMYDKEEDGLTEITFVASPLLQE